MSARHSPRSRKWQRGSTRAPRDWRLRFLQVGVLVSCVGIIGRLFFLQVVEHGFYAALASGQHEIFRELTPTRGEIFVHDGREGELVPVATNHQLAAIYADPRRIEDPAATATSLVDVLGFPEDQKTSLTERLSHKDDPYEPIKKEVGDDVLERVISLAMPGIAFVREERRLYPETGLGGQVLGFVSADDQGVFTGKYGIEGYFNDELSGKPGFLRSERDIAGRLISIGDKAIEPAVDGADIVLTIDRAIQFKACSSISAAVKQHGASGGSVIVLEPKTGRILAMCGYPDFEPSRFSEAESIRAFNNPAIFDPYEPGSIFKSVTMAAAIDAGAVTPGTIYEDTGEAKIEEYTIRNSDKLAHGRKTMTEVLEESLNTGTIFAMRAMGQDTFVQYVKQFGFGEETGIELQTEVEGDISPLNRSSEIFAATASFGQGITTTPLQMAMAYATIANGGILKKPRIVDEIRFADGTVERETSGDVRRVIESKTARYVSSMLVSVIESGHGKAAGVPGYYIAGKTGTAQVPRKDGKGYDPDVTIGSFAGFGPADDPAFVMVVRIDEAKDTIWAEGTAAPVFGDIADFLLRYLQVPPTR